MRKITSIIFAVIVAITSATAATKHAKESQFTSYKGLVMAGYQGWFNAPDDGANRGWNHYRKGNLFEPGACTIDAWPDVTEYEKLYATDFENEDGTPALTFSSYDKSTTDLHFKWMREYGIDGAFMQRFVQTIKSSTGLAHSNVVLDNALNAAEENNRAIAVMYDLSGMNPEDYQCVIDDWKEMVDNLQLTSRTGNNYLYHNGKPLVAIWGVGFGGRAYGYTEFQALIDFFKDDAEYGGCSILFGVPTYWRELGGDTDKDERLHDIIKQGDIVHPWHVGRFNPTNLDNQKALVEADIAWCKKEGLDYVPVIYPGFSWHNMNTDSELNSIPRLRGEFMWEQIANVVAVGAEMIYYAMFDEIDEATAIFKISNTPPICESPFITTEDMPTDHYLWLAGMGGKMMRHEIIYHKEIPQRVILCDK